MCNVSSRSLRLLQRLLGADLVTTQMVSCEGIVRNNPKAWQLMDATPDEAPVSVQLVGSNPDSLARAAQAIEARGATIIDLNLGCPAIKVLGSECGSALIRRPKLVRQIICSMRAAIRVPLTVKIRTGWNDEEITAIELTRICEGEGADAVALHARTREQAYRGQADWSMIARLKESVGIPVIGNGDVTSPADTVRMLRQTGCDAVMIGRAMVSNPWLLPACDHAANDYLDGRIHDESELPDGLVETEVDGQIVSKTIPHYMKQVTVQQRVDLVLLHTQLMVAEKGEPRGIREMRKHTEKYLRGTAGYTAFRERLMKTETLDDLKALLEGIGLGQQGH